MRMISAWKKRKEVFPYQPLWRWVSVLGRAGGILGMLLLLQCAHRVAPSGGPEDKTPPRVVRSVPEPGAVNVKELERIEIEFSEGISRGTLTNNFWLIPEPEQAPEIKWKGSKKLWLRLKSPLPDSTTLVLTLGTGIQDLHGNNLAEPFQLAFSTGPVLTQNRLMGRVYGFRKWQDVYIYAYRLHAGQNVDSLLNHRAIFHTQIDEQGHFLLNYLPDGRFRVIALEDRDMNRVYTMESDLVGLPFTDVVLDSADTAFTNLNFWMIEEDTTAPEVKSVDTVSNRQVQVEFSEPICLSDSFAVRVQDTLDGKYVPPLAYSLLRSDSTRLALYFSPIPAGRPMRAELRGVTDRSGNEPAQPLVADWTAAAKPDTLPPSFRKMTPAHKAENVPYHTQILLQFSAPVDTENFRHAVTIADEQGDTLDGRWEWGDLTAPRFIPDSLLEKSTEYTVQLNLGMIHDIFGRAFPDTLLSLRFTTISWTELGEISGRVLVQDGEADPVIVQAVSTENQHVYTTFAPAGKEFLIPFLPAGGYLLRAILDRNKNGRWDRGSTRPWQFAEPFVMRSDTVKVRKRWTTQGKIIRLIH